MTSGQSVMVGSKWEPKKSSSRIISVGADVTNFQSGATCLPMVGDEAPAASRDEGDPMQKWVGWWDGFKSVPPSSSTTP